MKLILHLPAWHNETDGDISERIVVLYLQNLPRKGDQIEAPGAKGVVEITNIRHRPVWHDYARQDRRDLPGGYIEHQELPPEIFCSWVKRPEDRLM